MAADVTGLLQAWGGGDADAFDQLAPLVHRELREMARRLLSGERLPSDGNRRTWGTQYDVSPDAQHRYFTDRAPAPRPSDIGVVMGWRGLLK